MTAFALVSQLICQRCWHSIAANTCTCRPDNPAALAAQVRDRHAAAVRRATHGTAWTPMPAAPDRTRWVVDRWDCAHLIGCDGASLCGKAHVGLGSRPAPDGARWCRTCAARTENT